MREKQRRYLMKRAAKFTAQLKQRQTYCEKIFGKRIIEDGLFKVMKQKAFMVGVAFRIVDFYFPKKYIAVEIDGGYHEQVMSKDSWKDNLLNKRGISVLRIKNEELEKFDFEQMYRLFLIKSRYDRFKAMNEYYLRDDTVGRFVMGEAIPDHILKNKEVVIKKLPPGPIPRQYCMNKYSYAKPEKGFKKKTIIRRPKNNKQKAYTDKETIKDEQIFGVGI